MRMRVPMRGTEAEQPAVAMKVRNGTGAKGLHWSALLGSCAKLYNSREGFEQFLKMTGGLKARHELQDVLNGMEPIGHYWRKLAYFVRGRGYEVRFVRTTAPKHHREPGLQRAGLAPHSPGNVKERVRAATDFPGCPGAMNWTFSVTGYTL